MHNFIGTHIIAEFCKIQMNAASDKLAKLIELVRESCLRNHVHVLKEDYHIFDNGGYTLFFLLEESHLSIHMYIEYQAAFIDIFTCGHMDAMNILDDIRTFYAPLEEETRQILRGREGF